MSKQGEPIIEEQTIHAPQEVKVIRIYSFPNVEADAPHSVQAETREEAEKLNAEYLKTLKKENT